MFLFTAIVTVQHHVTHCTDLLARSALCCEFKTLYATHWLNSQHKADISILATKENLMRSICYTSLPCYACKANAIQEGHMKSDVQLNLRAKETQRALIDAATEILHKSRTDFILEMAC